MLKLNKDGRCFDMSFFFVFFFETNKTTVTPEFLILLVSGPALCRPRYQTFDMFFIHIKRLTHSFCVQ